MRAIFLTGQYALWTVLFSHRLLRNENLGLSVLHHQFNVDTFNGERIPNIRCTALCLACLIRQSTHSVRGIIYDVRVCTIAAARQQDGNDRNCC